VSEALIDPSEITEATVIRPAPHVGVVEVDDRVVLVNEPSGQAHALNPTAAAVWWSLGEPLSVGALIDELEAVYGAPRDVIGRDVTDLVRNLGAMGLLAGVSRDVASLPIDIEFASSDECDPDASDASSNPRFDDRYLAAPPNG
jgi:hypothetical protein